MSPDPMVSPEAARSEARRRLTASHRRWTLDGWSQPVWTLPLRPPTERQVLADPAAAEAWVRGWAGRSLTAGLSLDWEDRTWRSVGTQRVPVRLVAQSPEDLAGFAGGPVAAEATRFAARVARIRTDYPAAVGQSPLARYLGGPDVPADDGDPGDPRHERLNAALRRHAERLTGLPDEEFDRMLGVLAWLARHPVAGLRPRQLPIRGVDSKWFSVHRTVLTALHGALASVPVDLGVVDADPRVRMRVLDPSMRPAGLEDLELPMAEAVTLDGVLGGALERVLIVENKETLLCLPEARGVLAIWGRGFDTAAAVLPWLAGVPITYWGDLDSQGFAILHRYRSHLPQVESVLMDEATLEDFADLWVPEPKPFRGALVTLTPAESRTVERLRAEGDVRLEQERVSWPYALARLASHLRLQVDG
ncbi:hypothetical protein GCM10010977_07060 [Citricoccus zhacaiensis]|uniref:DUF3322 and DUF2220 domain-containing protein n=1 Tax=Citricoccus zhacaiensis TaxID=489142 RepID=A0ABQ2LQX7_9MICC|nr:DUF3322 and DUF2220 domain-containing protein [Citricoccus zhacaiensis]GGO42094.1 hypothetical protein GCM10010977_07060 [Citricoccus zhacaiensis]